MTRALTADELILIRSEGQFSRLGLIIINPEVVFAAQVNGVPESDDEVNNVPYTNVSYGAASDIKEGMTMWIGTTSGGYEAGMVRAKGTSGSTINISPTSEITWVDGQYISVVNEYGLWPRQAKFVSGIFYCDETSPYTNQHGSSTQKPVPVFGPDKVLYMSGSSVSCTFDASPSWILGSATIATYAYTVSGSAAISGSGALQTFTFTSVGTYVIDCVVTTSTGVSTTGHRTVTVYSEAAQAINQFELLSANGDASSGGWQFSVKLYDQASVAQVRDRARCFLVTQDYYSGSAINIGPVVGAENIIASGWIDGETIEWNPQQSPVTFTVKGPHFWIDKLGSWPAGIRNVHDVEPAAWNEYRDFQFDSYLWHEITWRSTVAEVLDVYKSNDTRHLVGGTGAWGTVWSQIKQMGENALLISPRCNRYGQMYVQMDANYLTNGLRVGVPVVMEVTKADWQETAQIERRIVPEVGFVDATGQAWAGTRGTLPKRAGSWGTSIGRFGRMENRTNLVLHYSTDAIEQTELNEMAGILLGYFNNPIPRISFNLASNNRFFDIAPQQYGTFSMAASDTPRGITYTNQKFVPKTIEMTWNAETGTVFTSLTAEAQSVNCHGFYLPIFTGPPSNWVPKIPRTPWRKGVVKKPPFSPSPSCLADLADTSGPFNMYVNATVQNAGGGVVYYDKPLHCRVRAGTATNKTKVLASYTAFSSLSSGSAVSDWARSPATIRMEVWGLNMSGSPIIQAAADAYSGDANGVRTFVFSPAAITEVSGFRFQAVSSGSTSGSGAALTYVASGSIITSGSALPVVDQAKVYTTETPSEIAKMISPTDYGSPSPSGTVLYIKTTTLTSGSQVEGYPVITYAIDGSGVMAYAPLRTLGFRARNSGRTKQYSPPGNLVNNTFYPAEDLGANTIIIQNGEAGDVITTFFETGMYLASIVDARMSAFSLWNIYARAAWEIGYALADNGVSKCVIDYANIFNICNYYDPLP